MMQNKKERYEKLKKLHSYDMCKIDNLKELNNYDKLFEAYEKEVISRIGWTECAKNHWDNEQFYRDELLKSKQDLKVAIEALEYIKATRKHNTECIANMKDNIIGLTDVQEIATTTLAKLRKE